LYRLEIIRASLGPELHVCRNLDLDRIMEEVMGELNLGDGEIKGNFSKGKVKLLYHADPEHRWYQLCIPEIRFRIVKDAKYCGFRKWS